ncbi:hypothetical protein EAG_14127 [Camponotus floridanus]|uniref:Uncharacterized protein n=1 Tax=Camponotus floridanus TaxID=104421 RepID=E1ZXC5_CAMFO|nr:hypothetical protein EAG_14127 [Camponotus floridanus]
MHYGQGSSLRSTFDSVEQQQRDPIAPLVFSNVDIGNYTEDKVHTKMFPHASKETMRRKQQSNRMNKFASNFSHKRSKLQQEEEEEEEEKMRRSSRRNTKYQDETSHNKSVCRLTRAGLTQPMDSCVYKVPGRLKRGGEEKPFAEKKNIKSAKPFAIDLAENPLVGLPRAP